MDLDYDIRRGEDLIPYFKTFHLGPALAYNLPSENSTTNALKKTQFLIDKNYISPKNPIMLCFGEIDCRTQVIKQIQKGNCSVEEVVNKIIDNYFIYIDFLIQKGFKVILWGPIASQKDEWHNPVELPRVGSEVERNKATEVFNNLLKDKCKSHNIYFCSIFNDLIDENYKTKAEYIIDECHLSQKCRKFMHNELIKKNVLIKKMFFKLKVNPMLCDAQKL